jgi:hypothetical protein
MKNVKAISSLSASALMLAFAFAGCRKDALDNDTTAAKNESKAEMYFNEINDISDQVNRTGTTGLRVSDAEMGILDGCTTITFDTSAATVADPDTIVVDFGTGCVGNDGKTRSGVIRIIKTGQYFATGTVITIIPEGYTVNGNQLAGFRRLTNTGTNASGQPVFDVEVDATLTLADGEGVVTWTATRTRTWLDGYNTPLIASDDIFSVSGNSAGTKANGISWTSEITSPLTIKRSCREVVSGTLTLTPEDRPVRTIDYGNGACDNTITVTINGNSFDVNTN